MNSIDLTQISREYNHNTNKVIITEIIKLILTDNEIDYANSIKIFKYKRPTDLYILYASWVMIRGCMYNVWNEIFEQCIELQIIYMNRRYPNTPEIQELEKDANRRRNENYRERNSWSFDYPKTDNYLYRKSLIYEECKKKVINVLDLFEVHIRESMTDNEFNKLKKEYEDYQKEQQKIWQEEREKQRIENERIKAQREEDERIQEEKDKKDAELKRQQKEAEKIRREKEAKEREERRILQEIEDMKEQERQDILRKERTDQRSKELRENIINGNEIICCICDNTNNIIFNSQCGCTAIYCVPCAKKIKYNCCVCKNKII